MPKKLKIPAMLKWKIDAKVGATLLKKLMSLQICEVALESRIQFPDKRLADRAGPPIDKPLSDATGKALCDKLLCAATGKSPLGIDKPFCDAIGKALCKKLLCAATGKSPKGGIDKPLLGLRLLCVATGKALCDKRLCAATGKMLCGLVSKTLCDKSLCAAQRTSVIGLVLGLGRNSGWSL